MSSGAVAATEAARTHLRPILMTSFAFAAQRRAGGRIEADGMAAE